MLLFIFGIHYWMKPSPTSRINFRRFSSDDLELVFRLNSNPEVMRYVGSVKNRKEAHQDLERYLHYYHKYPGLGYWAAFTRPGDKFIGWFVVKILEETGEHELGYRLLPEFWGRGLATEGSLACLEYGVKHLGASCMVAVASPQNIASCRVLEKLGLQNTGTGRFYGVQCRYFKLDLDAE